MSREHEPSRIYIEFVGGPLDGAVQPWPEGRPPGRNITVAAGDTSPPQRALYRRSRCVPYGLTEATKWLYEFEGS